MLSSGMLCCVVLWMVTDDSGKLTAFIMKAMCKPHMEQLGQI
jgi:hypothetical protein